MTVTWKKLAYAVEVLPGALSPYAVGDLLYADSTTTLAKLADVAVGSYLKSGGIGVAPAWAALNQAAVAGLTTDDGPSFAHLHLADVAAIYTAAESWVGPSSTAGIYFKGGFVGIGTATPGANLHLYGGSSQELRIQAPTTPYDTVINLFYDTTAGLKMAYSANTALGTITNYYQATSSGYTWGNINFATYPGGGATPVTAMTISGYSGNVGIGTTAPLSKLDLRDGDFSLSGTSIAHPITDYLDTKIGFSFFTNPTYGGVTFRAITSSELTTSTLTLDAFCGTVAALIYPAFRFRAGKSDGSIGVAVLAATDIAFQFLNFTNPLVSIFGGGNVSIGGTANRGTVVGTAAIHIFNGTAPTGTLTNGCSIYSAAGELYTMDAAGNATLQTPHDRDNLWVFDSIHTVTGKRLRIDMEKMMRFLNDKFGTDFVHDFQLAA